MVWPLQTIFDHKSHKFTKIWHFLLLLVATLLLIGVNKAAAQNFVVQKDFSAIDTIWLLVAAALVFFMNAGFAMLETGFCRTENAINVLAKNLIVFCIATVAFWLLGFRLMFGDAQGGVFGSLGFLLEFPFPSAKVLNPFPPGFLKLGESWNNRSFASVFFFQLVFAGTAATIVSGAVAERIKFWAFILFSFLLVGIIYPITGHWVWGGGWLSADPIKFRDFAGSTVVHSVGGMSALVGAWLLKPRDGKFGYHRENNRFSGVEDTASFPPHNLALATLGCFILWLGWFGFNGGSTTRLEYVPHIIATTVFAGAVGGVAVVIFSPAVTGKGVSLSSIINGILGGLVGITASSAYVDVTSAAIIGALSGVIILFGENLLKFLQIDDPVGAVPVHLLCGGWGTLAVGIFASQASLEYDPGQTEGYNRLTQIFYQFLGWSIVVVVVGILSLLAWIVIGLFLYYLEQKIQPSGQGRRKTMKNSLMLNYGLFGSILHLFRLGREGMRVSLEKEREGSDDTITD